MGPSGRKKQLVELMSEHKIEVLALQETIKADFSFGELQSLNVGDNFSWNWMAARGHSGGSLTGVKQGDLDATEMDTGEFFSSIVIEIKGTGFSGKSSMCMGLYKLTGRTVFCRN